VRKRRTLAPSKEQRDAKESRKKWATAKIREDFRRRAGAQDPFRASYADRTHEQ
jgi:hypothetical protein